MKQELIKSFINGPLRNYLTGETSYSKFVEEINEICGTDFRYSDLYPSYLFNAELHYSTEEEMFAADLEDLSKEGNNGY